MHSVLESFRLDGKIAVITGGARTLGYDMAQALAEAGGDLVITSRDLAAAERAADRLRSEFSVEVLPLALDHRDSARVEEVAREAHNWKGHVDVLINNAGGGAGSGATHLFERSPEAVAEVMSTNLIGLISCCRAFGRLMAAQGHGRIVNVASIAGLVGRDRRMYTHLGTAGQAVDYAAAKAGVIGMTRDLAAVLGPMGINVNAISPGGFDRELPEAFVRAYSDRTPLGRMGRDGVDLKGAALFLSTAASDYVHGHNLVVDGGWSVWQ